MQCQPPVRIAGRLAMKVSSPPLAEGDRNCATSRLSRYRMHRRWKRIRGHDEVDFERRGSRNLGEHRACGYTAGARAAIPTSRVEYSFRFGQHLSSAARPRWGRQEPVRLWLRVAFHRAFAYLEVGMSRPRHDAFAPNPCKVPQDSGQHVAGIAMNGRPCPADAHPCICVTFGPSHETAPANPQPQADPIRVAVVEPKTRRLHRAAAGRRARSIDAGNSSRCV